MQSEVLERDQWRADHTARGYVKKARVIDGDILHAWVEASGDVVMDEMDRGLLELVISEAGLAGSPLRMILGLEQVTDLSLNYKQAIADIIYNWKPGFSIIVFYRVSASVRPLVDAFRAVVPSNLRVLIAEEFQEALEIVQGFKAGVTALEVEAPETEERAAAHQFLAAAARMSWMNMLDQHITLPPGESRYHLFFRALVTMQSDLKAREKQKELELERIRQELEQKITQMVIKMNAQTELNNKTARDYEKEIADLKSRIATQDMELTRVSTAIAEKTTSLRNLLDQIHALEIDTTVKRQMTDACLSLIETETIEKRLNIELTESDSVFLSKLQKRHPNLNQRELRIALLVKLNYDTREIARSIGISTRGMESIRYRMHKKLGLGKHQSIKTYLSDLAATL